MAKLVADLLSNADLNIATIESRLKLMGYTNLKRESGRTTSVLIDTNRIEALQNIENRLQDLNAIYDPNKGTSSVGAVTVGVYTIKARPASKQGSFSAGIQNELIMIESILQYTKDGPIDVKIIDASRKSITVKDVVDVQEVGRDTSGRKKADVNLITISGKKFPISIKKDNAEMWESADSYWAAKAKDIIDRLEKENKITVTPKGGVFAINPTVATLANTNEKRNVVFGSDILTNKGCVVVKTFSGRDFSIDKGTLVMNTTKIIDSMTDLKDKYEVYFLIRNDSSRKGSKIRPGLRVLAVQQSRINRNVLVV